MRVLALREKFDHMGNHSGYDQLFKHLGDHLARSIFRGQEHSRRFPLVPEWVYQLKECRVNLLKSIILKIIYPRKKNIHQQRKDQRLWHYLRSIKSKFYTPSSLIQEVELIQEASKNRYDVIHFSYLENHFALLSNGEVKSKIQDAKLVGTIHQTFQWWKANGNIDALRQIDALIVLSEAEKTLWNNVFPNKVHFVPHGIDTDYFTPAGDSNINFTCVIAGFWNRDFEMLRDVILHLNELDPEIHFNIIIPSARLVEIPDIVELNSMLPQVEIHHHLSDDELRQVYQQAHLMLLPLRECTANNALLEGLSSGLPIVTIDLPSIASYIEDTMVYRVKKQEYIEMANHALYLRKNEDIRHQMSNTARSHAIKNFHWGAVADQTLAVYQGLVPNSLKK
jgi:glycosyltransferase involved in cell wall biosynthesis